MNWVLCDYFGMYVGTDGPGDRTGFWDKAIKFSTRELAVAYLVEHAIPAVDPVTEP